MTTLRLGVNLDHVATVRNARGGAHPDPLDAARAVAAAGADGITLHLREDRRHIRDDDVRRVRAAIGLPLNLEMAATDEMVRIAREIRPHASCLVPERRQEVTTEGGLDVAGQQAALGPVVAALRGGGDPRVAVHRPRPGTAARRRRDRRAGGRTPYRRLRRGPRRANSTVCARPPR